jgi:hypothetical protein
MSASIRFTIAALIALAIVCGVTVLVTAKP